MAPRRKPDTAPGAGGPEYTETPEEKAERQAEEKARNEAQKERTKAREAEERRADRLAKNRKKERDTYRKVSEEMEEVRRKEHEARAKVEAWAKREQAKPRRLGKTMAKKAILGAAATRRKMNVDEIRMGIGLGALADTSVPFLEEVVDAEQRVTGYEVSPIYDGYRFGGTTAGSGPGRGSNTKGRSILNMQGMSVQEILQFYQSLSDSELSRFQNEMMMAGLFEGAPGGPVLGLRDPNTGFALGQLMEYWAANPHLGIGELLANLKSTAAAAVAASEGFGDMSGTGTASELIKNITYTDTDTWNNILDAVAVDLYGEKLSPERKAQLISSLQTKEVGWKTNQVNAEVQAEAAGTTTSELDAFMTALIGKESSGDPNAVNADSGAMGLGQILQGNWAPWANEAGANPGDFSEANQRKVIKFQLAKMYSLYGNWRDVAIAWYSGSPGSAWSPSTLDRPQDGYPSMNEYANAVVGQQRAILGAGLTTGTPKVTINTSEDMASPTVQAEEELKRLDPSRYYGKEFANRAEGFFRLIQGVG